MSEDSLARDPSTQRRKRAPSMSPEDRRVQLIDAAIPLMSRHGSSVTTAQVADAAGVAEGTIFRLFADKNSFLDAVLEHALDATSLESSISDIDPSLSARARILRAAEALRAHFDRALPVMHGAMRHGQTARTGTAVGRMFGTLLHESEMLFADEVSRGRVRGEARVLGRMLVGVCQSVVWQDYFERGPRPKLSTEQFVSVLLDGCCVLAGGDGSSKLTSASAPSAPANLALVNFEEPSPSASE